MLLVVGCAFLGAALGYGAFGVPGLFLGSVSGVAAAGILYFIRTEG
jgi:hypothetical protein